MTLNKHYYLMSDYLLTQYMVMLMNFTTNYLVMTGRWPLQREKLSPHIIFLEGVRDEVLPPRKPAQILTFERKS